MLFMVIEPMKRNFNNEIHEKLFYIFLNFSNFKIIPNLAEYILITSKTKKKF